MLYSKVGKSDLVVSRVAFGCAVIGGYDYGPSNDSDSLKAIHKAIDLGVNLFDVADVYGFGRAESVLGKALKGVQTKTVVASKVGVRWDTASRKTWRDVSGEYLKIAVEDSLKRLGVDCLDICQLHWPIDNINPYESLVALAELQDQGKINLLGVSNVDLNWLREAQVCFRVESLQLPLNLLDKTNLATIDSAVTEYSLGIFVYNALAHGLLTGKINKKTSFHLTDLRNKIPLMNDCRNDSLEIVLDKLKAIAFRLNKSPCQIAIKYLLGFDKITSVLIGTRNSEQAISNFNINFDLPDDLIYDIDKTCGSNGFR